VAERIREYRARPTLGGVLEGADQGRPVMVYHRSTILAVGTAGEVHVQLTPTLKCYKVRSQDATGKTLYIDVTR
jgi:hypothetical protein